MSQPTDAIEAELILDASCWENKWRVTQEKSGVLHLYRYGKEQVGVNNPLHSFAQTVEELREENKQLHAAIQNFLNGLDTGAIKVTTEAHDEELKNCIARLRAVGRGK